MWLTFPAASKFQGDNAPKGTGSTELFCFAPYFRPRPPRFTSGFRRSYLVDVRTLFAFAAKRKYVRENPGLAVDLPRVEENAPGILTPAQAHTVLDACIDTAPDILPVVALSLFGGLRRSEAEQLEWGLSALPRAGAPCRRRNVFRNPAAA